MSNNKFPQGREEEVKEVDWLCMKDRMDEPKCEAQCEKCGLDALKGKWFEICVQHRDEFRKWVKEHMTDNSDQVDSDWDLLQKGVELLGLRSTISHHEKVIAEREESINLLDREVERRDNELQAAQGMINRLAKATMKDYVNMYEALHLLVELKDIHENREATPEQCQYYNTTNPKAWEQARQLVLQFDEDK